MKKWKRSARLVDMTRRLLRDPHRLIPLTHFAERYQAAKSSISEDLGIIQEVFHSGGSGELETVSGAAGGVRFLPRVDRPAAEELVDTLCRQLSDPGRILPGGYLYLSDLLGNTAMVREIGRVFASVFCDSRAEVVVTVETKGIPLAYATADHLGLPVAIVRRDSRITEGSVVTINTVSGSSKRLGSLSLSRRSLNEGVRVLIIDDFMKAGGTVRGMIDLMNEFHAQVSGVGVMTDTLLEERLVENYVSLTTVAEVDVKKREIQVVPGNLLHQGDGFMDKVQTDRAPQAIGPYSQAVRAGGFVFVSGQIPLTAEGEPVTGGVEEQTRQVLTNLKEILDAAGSGLEQVVKTTIFLKDMNHFQQVNEVYARFFGEFRPARACVEVSRLPKDVSVEIEAVALVKNS